MFDHMGGINTLLHIIFNGGTIISPQKRNPEYILELIKKYNIELLPTTPTFLRMLLMSGMIPKDSPSCLKIITYGSEKMDESTLKTLCNLLPNVDFRQTYGLTEFSVLRLKSKSRNSLFFKIGGEGLETKVIENTLYLKVNIEWKVTLMLMILLIKTAGIIQRCSWAKWRIYKNYWKKYRCCQCRRSKIYIIWSRKCSFKVSRSFWCKMYCQIKPYNRSTCWNFNWNDWYKI